MAAETVRLKGSMKPVKLGRIRPKSLTDCGTHVAVELPNGETRNVAKLGRHFTPEAGGWKPPPKTDWWTKATPALREMLGNDQYGDCVIASVIHRIGGWTGNESPVPAVGSTAEAVEQYHKICGQGDNGCVITNVLDHQQRSGILVAGKPHKIDAYVAIDHTNRELVQSAIAIFGPINVGINLPGDWTCTNCDWGPSNSRIVGGHDVACVDYDERGVIASTWAGRVTILWEAFTSRQWVEECYLSLTPDWYEVGQRSPSGFDLAALKRDIDVIKNGNVPSDDPPAPPGPNPTPPPDPGQDWKGTGQLTLFGLPARFSFRASTDPYPPPKEKTEDSIGHPAWRKILKDALALVLAATTMNVDALAAALKQLLTDLGYQPDSHPQ